MLQKWVSYRDTILLNIKCSFDYIYFFSGFTPGSREPAIFWALGARSYKNLWLWNPVWKINKCMKAIEIEHYQLFGILESPISSFYLHLYSLSIYISINLSILYYFTFTSQNKVNVKLSIILLICPSYITSHLVPKTKKMWSYSARKELHKNFTKVIKKKVSFTHFCLNLIIPAG